MPASPLYWLVTEHDERTVNLEFSSAVIRSFTTDGVFGLDVSYSSKQPLGEEDSHIATSHTTTKTYTRLNQWKERNRIPELNVQIAA